MLERPPLVTETLNTFSMIRFNTLLPLVLLVLGVSSCQKADIDVVEHEPMTVSLNLAGDFSVDVTQDPLTRAASTDDAYALNVYYDKEGDGSVNDIYAYGLFDNVADMTITLLSNHKYDIYCSLIRDAKTYLSDYFSLTNNGLALVRDEVGPFYYYHHNYFNDRKCYLQTNRFFYNSNKLLYFYIGVNATTTSAISSSYFESKDIREGELLKTKYPTCTDWFYGEVNKYTPNGEVATMDIELKRVGFRLKYELSGVTDGEVTVKVYNNDRTFINSTTNTASYESEEQFIAFYDTYSAWLYADNYTENLTVAVVWKRGIGVTQDLGTKTIQVKRNCLNNIRIALTSDDKGAGISLNTESEDSMGETGTTIPLS